MMSLGKITMALGGIWLLCTALTKSNRLFVFIGEKIDVHEIELKAKPGQILMDGAFLAKYRVIEKVYGDYSKDTISFQAFDHYGFPPFAKFRYVLLYVSEYEGKLYHEKYQYSPVFKAKNGRWAGPYAQQDYNHPFAGSIKIKPEKIDFGLDAVFTLERQDTAYINRVFPKPYYRFEENKAIPIIGNYVPELFELKKQGVLKARGLF
jgi:hypothetical protein